MRPSSARRPACRPVPPTRPSTALVTTANKTGAVTTTTKKRRTFSRVALEKLAKPKEIATGLISSSITDCEECTFTPQISKFANEADFGGTFLDRVKIYIEDHVTRKNSEPPVDPMIYPFEPHLESNDLLQSNGKDFLERMHDDMDKRTKQRKILAEIADQECTFKPNLENSGKFHKSKAKESFLERVQLDIKERNNPDRTQQLEESLNCQNTFAPKLNKLSPELQEAIDSRGSFLARLQNDLMARKQNEVGNEQRTDMEQFKPKTVQSKISKQYASFIEGSFIDRYDLDIATKQRKLDEMRAKWAEKEAATCTFQPDCEVSKKSGVTSKMSGMSFERRMEEDLNSREIRKAEIEQIYTRTKGTVMQLQQAMKRFYEKQP